MFEKLEQETKEINNYLQLEQVLKLLNYYYDRETFNKLYNESEQESKTKQIKEINEILQQKQNQLYNNLGLDNLKLNDNENNLFYDYELYEKMEDYTNIYYYYELTDLTETGLSIQYLRENNYNICISSYNHLILDMDNKILFDISEDNETDIILNLIEKSKINTIDNFKLSCLQELNQFNKTIEYNTKDNLNLYKLSFENCKHYNEKDNYIIIDNIKDNWKTVFEIDLSISDITDNLTELTEIILSEL